ncbi:hypothetical protein IAI18_04430 [Acetobacteraceae bacterium H6797]|nr:hypothetical protein [Acetobacteraceae bacterium H6797]
MTDVSAKLQEILDRHHAAPFLFIGSGFSRRYLGLEDWTGLLTRFCEPINKFGYYSAKADRDLPLAASYIADDYNEWWWKSDVTEDSRNEFSEKISNRADALKLKYLNI